MRVVAVLETMWDWRRQTSGAGYNQAPRYFRINPENYSGKRLYKLVGDARLLVTNACPQLGNHANKHGTPDPAWLAENLKILDEGQMNLLLVCGKVAQATYDECGYVPKCNKVLKIPHPAARGHWKREVIADTAKQIRDLLTP